MSELRWNWVYYPYLDAPNEQEESALKAGYIKVVIKDEADKVIADLKAENESLKKTLQHSEDELESYFIFEKEIQQELRHQKYKRCLAMARRCHSESLWWYSKGYGFEKYDKFWEKWENRWLELAEKFKEAK